ncbi:MAG: Cytochrome c553 [Rhodobacteraceae bacterium HLUCCA12]|nr:MAG: Cytochrome c553 [Rhodobacteraceae bacterium HLUCCA12]
MRTVVLTLVAVAGLALAAGVSVVAIGLYNVSAQAGHWPGVSWMLHTIFRNSVRLRAPSMEDAPDLSDPDLVALGAWHYATACLSCHAAPGTQRSSTIRAMVPEPRHIRDAIEGWRPNHLHWIVENGAKMTGMPGWPAEGRGDEVWAVVAYLEAIRSEADDDAPDPTTLAPVRADEPVAYCTSCHGAVAGPVPQLSLLDADYIETQLRAYADGRRPSGIMQHAASLIDESSFEELADHFAEMTPRRSQEPPESADGAEALATRGTDDVPACTACHGPGAQERPERAPAIAGQNAAYIAAQLMLWRDGVRTGSPRMQAAARDLSDTQIMQLADWFAARTPDQQGEQE